MKAVVTGMIATYPVAGVLWDYVQYAIGFERLGWDVYYLEDSGLASYHPAPDRYLQQSLAWFSPTLARRWHYRTATGESFGLPPGELGDVLREADLFLNISGGCLMRDAYLHASPRVLIDTDPGLNHFVNFPKWDAAPGWQGTHGYRAHDGFFTYAENLGKPGCPLPDLGLGWQPTRPPVVLDLWRASGPAERWTTVMSWQPFQHYRAEITHAGAVYGAKEMEFQRFVTLPRQVAAPLEIAVGGNSAPVSAWREQGWRVIDAVDVSRDPASYRDYIQASRGEFSVAKNVYTATHCGWFSCRSVCYLAAGLPVVVQDTGFSDFIPTGEGLFAVRDVAEAARAIERVESDRGRHCAAALALARTQFASELVLGELLNGVKS